MICLIAFHCFCLMFSTMTKLVLASVLLLFGLALAKPDPVLLGSHGLRYEYHRDPKGIPHLLDTWRTLSDLQKLARYNPDLDDQYHLFTRANPSISQPLINGNEAILSLSNFDASKKTVFVIHGGGGSVTTDSNTVLIPAVLAAEDANVIAIDWSKGAAVNYFPNTLASAQSSARFINWLYAAAGVKGEDVVLIGFSLGNHKSSLIAEFVDQKISYLCALDPSDLNEENNFNPDNAEYTEAIHTSVLWLGSEPVGHVNFYPNGGDNNPGCAVGDNYCQHERAYFFMAESLISGGFTGTECETLEHALNGTCSLPGRLNMGGLKPKTGKTGIYHLTTNASPPFSTG